MAFVASIKATNTDYWTIHWCISNENAFVPHPQNFLLSPLMVMSDEIAHNMHYSMPYVCF